MKWKTAAAATFLLALAVVPTAMNSAPAQNAADAQQRLVQWEYKVINAPSINGSIAGFRLEPRLDELGLEGWECAGTISDVRKDTTHGHVILKRIKH